MGMNLEDYEYDSKLISAIRQRSSSIFHSQIKERFSDETWFQIRFTFKSIQFSLGYLLSVMNFLTQHQEDWPEYNSIILECIIFQPIWKWCEKKEQNYFVEYPTREKQEKTFEENLACLPKVLMIIFRKGRALRVPKNKMENEVVQNCNDILSDLPSPNLQKIFLQGIKRITTYKHLWRHVGFPQNSKVAVLNH